MIAKPKRSEYQFFKSILYELDDDSTQGARSITRPPTPFHFSLNLLPLLTDWILMLFFTGQEAWLFWLCKSKLIIYRFSLGFACQGYFSFNFYAEVLQFRKVYDIDYNGLDLFLTHCISNSNCYLLRNVLV